MKMGKHGKYEKHYNKSWELAPEMAAWISKNPDPNALGQEAYCKFCKVGLRAHKTDLLAHAVTQKHRRFAESLNNQRPISTFGINVVGDATKLAEIKLSVFVALHSAVRTIDHLGEIVQKLGKKSQLESIRLHRTKCSQLLKNVLSPTILSSLVEDIGDRKYSLIIDESTDVSVQKYLALCIRYFSEKEGAITTDFLGIVSVTETTSNCLYQHITSYFNSINLPVKNLFAIGTDGASNMVGVNHSVFTLLRDNIPLPNLILIRCICHSSNLCASKAADVLPAHLEYLIRESRNWFCLSAKRMEEYRALFNLINDNNKKMLALIQLCDTRWLAYNGAVRRILDQWLELKTHFSMIATKNQDKCLPARHLARIYNDPANHLYLLFLKSILQGVTEVNLLFQSTDRDIYELFDSLWTLILSVATRFIKPLFIEKAQTTQCVTVISEALNNTLALKSIDEVDLGVEFHRAAVNDKVPPEVVTEVSRRCREYLLTLCEQLVNRMPNNLKILKDVSKFASVKVLSPATKPSINDIPPVFIQDSDLTAIDNQLRDINLIPWNDHFSREILNDTSKFWSHAYTFKNASGRQVVKELAGTVLKILSLPVSNAVVERVFSVMNCVKTKYRNKMQIDMLTAILRIRIHCYVRKLRCTSFEPTQQMFQLFTAKMYEIPKSDAPGSSHNADEIDVLEETLTLFSTDEAESCTLPSAEL
ncbi:uncharacterized protein LOC107042750 [Diachasma alloeum]|uniref:uncharacterized protein LOC107042750 n=1 Tax=Diachasma alloeum TaxID=454923 RepID=UPI0007384FA8|nr:uncharacterized protein LOC107042750 [Diachasma alloeum]